MKGKPNSVFIYSERHIGLKWAIWASLGLIILGGGSYTPTASVNGGGQLKKTASENRLFLEAFIL